MIAFDCRNRKWYIQAATSPKNVVILVDVSGSMKGLRLTIARQTVSSVLDTLGDDDFFNIIAVRPVCVCLYAVWMCGCMGVCVCVCVLCVCVCVQIWTPY